MPQNIETPAEATAGALESVCRSADLSNIKQVPAEIQIQGSVQRQNISRELAQALQDLEFLMNARRA
ncbi:hypothetical protein [Methylobacterium sp. WSM2598]|uniref:hypothetical protein n=1 Tax=Methylobacterium sp. WSM2598 TaxID=398261 RepID=UPI0012F6363C|nr:hypothetical protein [Methylobacterium sp. WSM2598]